MSRINSKIRQRINSDKLSIKDRRPSNSEGQNGDIRIATVNGVNILFGKISGEWYNFGNGKKIGYRNKAALRQKVSDDHIRQLNVDADLFIKKAKFNVTDIDYLNIDSKVFDIESSTNTSKISIGDISLQPSWGTTGSTIKLENLENAGSSHLNLLGSSSTAGNNSGGNTILSCGLKTPMGSGSNGSITLGAGDSGTSAATALNVNATSTVLSGTLTINTINTDTAGDNYLVEVSGVVKKRTPAEVLSDIGVTFGIADTNAVRIDGGDIASGEYARFTSNGLESRTLGEIKSDIGTGNSALVPSAGTSGHFLKHDGTFGQVAYSNLSGTPSIPTNYITNDADDTMAGTLTIDKDYSTATAGTTKGLFIDLDRTGNVSSGVDYVWGIQTLVDVSGSSNHVQLVYGMEIQVDADDMGSGSSQAIGLNLSATGADTNIGIFNNTVDGGTDYKQVSSADTGDFFSMVTTANGVTTLETVDADAQLANLTIKPDGKLLMEMDAQDSEDDAWAITNDNANMMSFKTELGAENTLKIYEAGAPQEDNFYIEVGANGATSIQTVDIAGANANLTINPDGQLRLYKPPRIKEQASADSDQANYGQLWVKNDTPNNLYFTNDAGNDVQITNGSSLAGGGGTDTWVWQQSMRWYTRYGYYYHPSTTYGATYYNWSSANTSALTSWNDAYNPCIVVPKNMSIKSYHLYGNFTSAQTYVLCIKKGTPTYGSAGNTSLSTLGSEQTLVVGTANINEKIEETGLSISLSAGDIIIPTLRRTTNTASSSYYFCEGVLNIIGEYT